jgi:FdrA protein
MSDQMHQLQAAGVKVYTSNETAATYVGRMIAKLEPSGQNLSIIDAPEVNLLAVKSPLAAINVGLETFTESLNAQGAQVIQVDWRPPASGDEKLMAILERMKGK